MGPSPYPISTLQDGYKIAARDVLDASRSLESASASAAVMHRAYLEASFLARERMHVQRANHQLTTRT